jgi:hypothetical protein
MKVSAWCSRSPYIDHVLPVWRALPEEIKGRFYVHADQRAYAETLGLEPVDLHQEGDDLLIVCSRSEFGRLPKGVPIVFLEHGAGASYDGSHVVALHARYMPPVAAVLTTPAQQRAHRQVFGDRVHVVGCPKLDQWATYKHKKSRPPVVAFSHHWDEKRLPETRSSWPWDAEAWGKVAASGRYRVLGHKHPVDKRDIEGWCQDHGIEFVERFAEVLDRADLFVADNSSTLYEFAATGRPVVVLSPPWYRRDVDHGARFWSHVPGLECSIAEHLEAAIAEALKDVPERVRLREAAVEAVYGPRDGQATERCVAAIESLKNIDLAELPPTKHLPRPNPKRQTGTLRYPITLGVNCELEGVSYPKGTRVDRDTAVALKAAGQLRDPRIQ